MMEDQDGMLSVYRRLLVEVNERLQTDPDGDKADDFRSVKADLIYSIGILRQMAGERGFRRWPRPHAPVMKPLWPQAASEYTMDTDTDETFTRIEVLLTPALRDIWRTDYAHSDLTTEEVAERHGISTDAVRQRRTEIRKVAIDQITLDQARRALEIMHRKKRNRGRFQPNLTAVIKRVGGNGDGGGTGDDGGGTVEGR